MEHVVSKQRALGVVPAFLSGLVTSLFVFNFALNCMKGRLGVNTPLVTIESGIETQRPAWVYFKDSSESDDSFVRTVKTSTVGLLPSKDTPTLLILVFSTPEAKDMRQAVRTTWASDLKDTSNVMYFFVVNTLQSSSQLMGNLEEENYTHGDIIFLSETSSPMPNSRALLHALELVHKNLKFKFLLKCNDGSYVRVSEILRQLEGIPGKELVWGYFSGNESVRRKGPHAEKTWNLCIKYLPYPQGGGYILSHDIVSMLVAMGPDLSHTDNEDIAVGAWLAPFNIQRRHDVKFNTGLRSRGCSNTYLITYAETVKIMMEKHQSLRRSGKLCTFEHQDMFSYVYNWSVPMTNCCILTDEVP